MKHIISLGAGVQSSTMALMAAKGEITPMPTACIFADTGWEPKRVMVWLDWLEKQLPFPVYRVQYRNLRENLSGGMVPFFTSGGGLMRRACTDRYKIRPVQKKIRELTSGEVTLWIGISLDEATRMKPSQKKKVTNTWPLIDKAMRRADCLNWMERNGYPTPEKSSCIGCPYHDLETWRDMKLNDPESWEDAVQADKEIRVGVKGAREDLYLHRSLKPLDEVDFRNLEDMGQINMFENDCSGSCGV
jgi:hypothetical protein